MPLFSKVFKSKDANKKLATSNANGNANAKPQWVDSWLRTRVDPEEVADLLHGCTQELKSRALDVPLLLLPFRPSSDPSAARTFVRNFFMPAHDRPKMVGKVLVSELKMTEVMVLISVMKWCWARLPGGVVTWETYKMFRIGENDSRYARDSFQTFIPISVDSDARVRIINDFFDLLAALAAHGKTNGLSGHKLSRYAGWWAFEHYDTGKGFEAGYKAWNKAADATCHLFFAYLRSMCPEPGKTNGVLDLPRSLQQLVATTDYPPLSSLLSNDTTKVVMVVDVVSPTPYALLRRAKNFEYRDDDHALREFTNYEDPVDALTDECRRVLRAISNTNQSNVSDAKTSTSLVDPSWSRFEDIGFSSALEDIGENDNGGLFSFSSGPQGLSSTARSQVTDLNRPTTPSWADFLSSGFVNENGTRTGAPVLLPPDKMLPPIDTEPRMQSSQSHRRNFDHSSSLEPGELASITKVNIDDSFWWVWISSLAGEEPVSRKACFGRCALIETRIYGGRWMVMEEQVKGAAPEPVQGAYIAEKKSFLGFATKRGRLGRRRSVAKKSPLSPNSLAKSEYDPASLTTIAPDQEARIHKAAIALANKRDAEENAKHGHNRRGRFDDPESKNNSIFTLGPQIKDEASPALQWAKQYDKNAIRAQYLGNQFAGKGSSELLNLPTNGINANSSATNLSEIAKEKELPTVPVEEPEQKPQPRLGSPVQLEEHRQAPSKQPYDLPTVSLSEEELASQKTAAEPKPLSAELTASTETEPIFEVVEVTQPSFTVMSEKVVILPEQKTEPATLVRPSTTVGTKNGRSSPEEFRKTSFQGDSREAQRPNGIKRLFGTIRKNRDEPTASPPAPSGNTAVAAARRALESKINPPEPSPAAAAARRALDNRTNPSGPAPVRSNIARYESVKQPTATTTAVATISDPVPISQPTSVELPMPEREEPQLAPAPIAKDSDTAVYVENHDYQPPKTRRDEEFDQLSRVDTGEREHADKEFSRFDQGPLLDQPAVLPTESLLKEESSDESDGHIKRQSVYSAVTMDQEDTDSDDEHFEEAELAPEVSANDRWAQIRRNAAERAGRASDDHGTRSRTETRTDDGETSGEETIESRVARIKARVAELTGNMDGVRR